MTNATSLHRLFDKEVRELNAAAVLNWQRCSSVLEDGDLVDGFGHGFRQPFAVNRL